jgi:hypothetical protein
MSMGGTEMLRRILHEIASHAGNGPIRDIADWCDVPRRRSVTETIDEIHDALDGDHRILVSAEGPLSVNDWNALLEARFKAPRRRSYEAVIEELESALGAGPADVVLQPTWKRSDPLIRQGEDARTTGRSLGLRAKGEPVQLGETATDVRSKAKATTQQTNGTSGDQFFAEKGVWSQIERWLSDCPRGAEMIWVTYSFEAEPGSALLRFLTARQISVAVLCKHPRSGVTLARQSLDAWHSAGLGVIYGLKTRQGEDEEDAPGPLHAKAISVRSTSGHFGILGSFNLARRSLEYNTETVIPVRGADAERLWLEAEALLKSPFVAEVTVDDCADEAGIPLRRHTIGRHVTFSESPATVGDRYSEIASAPSTTPLVVDSNDPKCRPEALGWLKRAVEMMMHEWPGADHPSRGWQLKTFRRLCRKMENRASTADVLYLPVGVGKTFIAIRWLLEQFDETLVEEGKKGVFLAPNEWVQRSVKRDLGKITERTIELCRRQGAGCAEEDVNALVAQCLAVLRPSQLGDFSEKSSILALVADECHNWSAVGGDRGTAEGYAALVEYFRRKRRTRVLGLTATPCRMDHGKYDTRAFLRSFRDPSYPNPKPLMTLARAISGKLLASYHSIPLLSGEPQAKVARLLGGDEAVVSMGDYHLVVLRKVWSLLMRYQKRLIEEIEKGLASSRRALVFMPPVAEEGDAFVSRVGKSVREMTGRADSFFDFRDRSDSDESARAMFERFRDVEVDKGRPAVLVTVNRFSEGVSINDIDTLVMLRATLSPRVAVQALGRGLRRDPDRPGKRCQILDAVGFVDRLQQWETGGDLA